MAILLCWNVNLFLYSLAQISSSLRFWGAGVGHRATRKRTETISQEADTTIPNENEDNFEDDETGNSEQLEDELESSSESDIGDEETRKDVGEPEDEFDGEDGEEPWGVDEYTAEGYACP